MTRLFEEVEGQMIVLGLKTLIYYHDITILCLKSTPLGRLAAEWQNLRDHTICAQAIPKRAHIDPLNIVITPQSRLLK